MKRLIIMVGLLVSGCYPLRNARFVDESQDRATGWMCVPDDEPTNPMGIKCADLDRIEALQADAGIVDVMLYELPRAPETDTEQL